MADAREQMVDTLRGRILRGIHSGTLVPGDRMPTSREVAAEFEVDYRLAIVAYKELQREGLVELRPRGGVYISQRAAGSLGIPPLPQPWLVDVFAAGLAREIPAPELSGWLQRCLGTLRLRATAVASTHDQLMGLSRELRDDFGLEVDGLLASDARADGVAAPALRRADLIITTETHAHWARALAAEIGKTVIVVEVSPELLGGEWAILLRRPVYVVVASPTFADMVHDFYAHVRGIENLHVIVFGRDDLSAIPEGAATYVTQQVRTQLGQTRVPGRILPAARTLSSESAREIFAFIVRSNIQAMSRLAR